MPTSEIAEFWKETIAELATVRMDPEVTKVDSPNRQFNQYKVSIRSFDEVRIRANFYVPADKPPRGGWPVIVTYPGYGRDRRIPIPAGQSAPPGIGGQFHQQLVMEGYALLAVAPRGQGESEQEWRLPDGDTYYLHNILDKSKYFFRKSVMDCIRGVDFACSREEIDADRIGMWSRSTGGYYTLMTASLDHRPRALVAEQPAPVNIPYVVEYSAKVRESRPHYEVADYLAEHPDQRELVYANLAYFDPLNLVDAIEAPTMVDVGMQDPTTPYPALLSMFERIKAFKCLLVYQDIKHESLTSFNRMAHNWLQLYL